MSDHPPLVNMEKLGEWHARNRVGNCRGDRETWPCQAWRDAEALNTLHAELLAARAENERLKARLETVERERDEWGGKAASAQYEASAFRRQRDEAQQALAQVVGQQEGAPA